jgi:hypothetical protein
MELRNTGSGWNLYQEGTYAPDAANHRWMPSIAMDATGNIALGYSISSTSTYPSIRYTGRLASDPLGSMTIAEKGIINGGGSQTDASGRWGDYTAMSVDPAVPGTFWYTNQYYSTTSGANWQTRIASFSIGNAFASYATASPGLICAGKDSVQLKSIAYGGSGTYTFSWSSVPAGFTSTLQNPKAAPTQNTQYVVSVNDGTQTRIDSTFTVTVAPAPVVFAGNDTIVDPTADTLQLHGIAENVRIIQWQTSGDGTFSSTSQLNATYTFGSADKTTKSVNLKLNAAVNAPCSNTSSTRHISLWSVGVQDISKNGTSLSIQPNPAKESVSITISGLENKATTLVLLNMSGQTVYTADLIPSSDKFTQKIGLSSFAKGVYVVRLKTDGSTETKQLVIQ